MEIGITLKRIFLIFGLLIVTAACMYYARAYPEYESSRIREKALDRQQEVSLLSGIVDLLVDNDGTADGVSYREVLEYALKYIDTDFTSTFAQLYDENLNPLIEISPGLGGGQKHNPLLYDAFVEAVQQNEFGSLTYWYETPQVGGREVYMTFRWVPSDSNQTNRYLIAVAISKYSVSERLADHIKMYTLALVIVTSLYIIVTSIAFCLQPTTKKEK